MYLYIHTSISTDQCELFTGAVRTNKWFDSATNFEVKKATINWLKNAGDRTGDREARRQRQEQRQNE